VRWCAPVGFAGLIAIYTRARLAGGDGMVARHGCGPGSVCSRRLFWKRWARWLICADRLRAASALGVVLAVWPLIRSLAWMACWFPCRLCFVRAANVVEPVSAQPAETNHETGMIPWTTMWFVIGFVAFQ